MKELELAKENFLKKEENLSKYATKSSDAIRLKEDNEDIRPAFFRDIDRIIHSLSYTRYLDKTQVYTFSENDHISKRMTHVQLVSKIARTIGRALNLNEDLIEAIALGHDIGHTPLGHQGEAILDKIAQEELGISFAHNIQSVRYYMLIAKNGKGLNLTIQTLDGIMTHNGEMVSPIYEPQQKDKKEFLREFEESYENLKATKKYRPMTLEGCVVRISDIIGYIGRDIEDAIILGEFKREDLPKKITDILGDNNKDIVNNLILDIIKESINKPYIKLSDNVYRALFELKKFNYQNIYDKSLSSDKRKYYEDGIRKIFKIYLNDIENENKDSIIYKTYLNDQDELYLDSTNKKMWVIDFISGMTDDFLLEEIKKYE